MNTIELVNTLPRVFAGQPGIQSEVWLKTLRFERGKKYLISAESGCGKSSLCAYLYGYRKDYEGTFLFDGRSIDELTVEEWCDVRRRHIAYLPQEMRLFPELTALENVELKNRLTGHKTTAEIRSLFERLGVADRADRPAGKLSIILFTTVVLPEPVPPAIPMISIYFLIYFFSFHKSTKTL